MFSDEISDPEERTQASKATCIFKRTIKEVDEFQTFGVCAQNFNVET